MDYNDFEQRLRDIHSSTPSGTDQDSEEPSVEQSASHTPSSAVDMDGDSDMPDLQSISDSDSDQDALEVEMHALVDDPPLPEVEAPAPVPTLRPNRRARVEDDEDDERDRRHPTERINTPLSGQGASGTPQQPDFPFPFNLFGPPPSAPNTPSSANPAANPGAPPVNNTSAGTGYAPQFFPGGIAISIDLGPAPLDNPTFLNDLLGIEPDVEDPERAERLISGLDEVPVGLVRRLEQVGGTTGANGDELSGGDSGCAVCWERLLDLDNTDDVKKEYPRIVALPCAHVFHAECLRPWFSRPKHTTCPTCRFNIDPDSLTYVPYRQRRRAQEEREQAAGSSSSGSQSSTSQTTPPTTADNPMPSTAAGPSTTAEASPIVAPEMAATSATAAEVPESAEARGRMGPPPDPTAPTVVPPPRRTSSEPPTNRRPRSTLMPEVVQSFAVPGGHVVVVNHPIGILTDAQGRPTGVTGQQPQEAAGATPASQTDSPPAPGRPSTPPNATRRTTLPGGGELPPGVDAFDFRLPFPLPFFPPSAPQPQQTQQAQQQAGPHPQPIRLPANGFAGVNFGNRLEPASAGLGDFLHRLFTTAPAPAAAANSDTPAADATAGNPATPQPPPAPPVETPQPTPPTEGQQNQEQLPDDINNFLRNMAASLNNPAFLFRLLMAAAGGNLPMNGVPGGAGPQGPRPDANAPKREWTPPPAPGPTLRQRVEKREREAGLRCYDVSCGIGPSDEDPFVALTNAVSRQLSIRSKGDDNGKVCPHTFHSSCLVSAERVASRGADAAVVDGHVEVSCPICRGVGVVSKVDWDDGVHNLE